MRTSRPKPTPRRQHAHVPGRVALERALSKLGLASRANARELVIAGRVRVNDARITNPATLVVPERIRVVIDDEPRVRGARRILAFHKPRGVVTTRRDPEGRRTVFDVLGDAGEGLIAVGRLDMTSTGLLLFTNDTRLAHSLADPANRTLRRYVVTVRGRVHQNDLTRLERGIDTAAAGGGVERLAAARMEIRKASARETHLLVDLIEGKNREVRRLFEAIGHEVTRLHRISFGAVELGTLQPGEYREVDALSLCAPRLPRAGEAS